MKWTSLLRGKYNLVLFHMEVGCEYLSQKGFFFFSEATVGKGQENLSLCHRQNCGSYSPNSKQQVNILVPPGAWKLRSDFYF